MLVAVVLEGSVALAHTGAPCLAQRPFMGYLGSTTHKVAMTIQTNVRLTSRSVVIAGKTARVQATGGNDTVYTAFIPKGRLRVGHEYPVRAHLCNKTGCLDYHHEIYLHRSFTGR